TGEPYYPQSGQPYYAPSGEPYAPPSGQPYAPPSGQPYYYSPPPPAEPAPSWLGWGPPLSPSRSLPLPGTSRPRGGCRRRTPSSSTHRTPIPTARSSTPSRTIRSCRSTSRG